jgi:hypothetical protein
MLLLGLLCCLLRESPPQKKGLTPNPSEALEPSGLSKPSRPTTSRPGGLPAADHSALLGRTPSAKDSSTPATPGNVFDRLSSRCPVRHLFFAGGWAGMVRLLAPLPRPLGFAIGGGAGALRVGGCFVFTSVVLGRWLLSGLILFVGWRGLVGRSWLVVRGLRLGWLVGRSLGLLLGGLMRLPFLRLVSICGRRGLRLLRGVFLVRRLVR